MKLSYSHLIFTHSKLTINTRKWCEISPKLTKNLSKKGRLQDLSDSYIHLSSCEESDFIGSDTDSDAEL